MRLSGRLSGRVLGAALGLWGVAVSCGCMSYSSMNSPGGVGAVTSPNARVPSEVVREALRYVTVRYPAGDRFTVNLVAGTNATMADFIMRELPAGAELVSHENGELPTYSVGAVRVRGNEAKVDVLRPVVEMGKVAGGGYATQAVTVHLEGGLNPWRVTLIQRWAVGAVEVPERWYVGDSVKPEVGADAVEGYPASGEAGKSAPAGEGAVDEAP